MKKVNNCTLCEELSNNSQVFDNDYSFIVKKGLNVIYKDIYYTILPSVGPLNEYHLLIATNQHFKSFSEINVEMFSYLRKVIKKIVNYNKDILSLGTIFFEHGSCVTTKNDSSCLEHAHLHCIGSDVDILENIMSYIKFEKIEFYDLLNYNTSSYLLYIDTNGTCWINNSDLVQSQFFRKVYSEITKKEEQWNWRQYPNIELVKTVIKNYKGLRVFP